MKINHLAAKVLGLVVLSSLIYSCKKDKVNTPDVKPVAVIEDSVYTSFSPAHYTLYSLKNKAVVPIEDSATTQWDFGVRFTNLIFNGGISGPGVGGVIIQKGDFDTFTDGPTTGYVQDNSDTLAVNGTPFNPNAWYEYIPNSHGISPKAGQFFLVKTADGKFAKLDIFRSGYHGWDGNNAHIPDTIVYNFRYVYQPNGTADFNLHN